jgi:hypothetical protein
MIGLSGNVAVYLACGVTDMRRYAERRIMRGPRRGRELFSNSFSSMRCRTL